MNPKQHAKLLILAGLSVIPIGSEKKPAVPSWAPYMKKRTMPEEVGTLWSNDSFGFGIVCGPVSDGLEVIDFDDPDAFARWHAAVQADECLPADLPIIKTPGGWHVYLKRPVPGRNTKLARRGKETIIETRGDGGYVVGPGSPSSCHPDGGVYEQVFGRRLTEWNEVSVVDDATYQALFSHARALNESPDIQLVAASDSLRMLAGHDRDSPGADYNERSTWDQVLIPHGWRKSRDDGKRQYWIRPGKEKGTSATTGFCSNGVTDLLYIFSSNAAPFEDQKCYDKFGAYARLNHNGDFKEAARALVGAGFGKAGKIGVATKVDALNRVGLKEEAKKMAADAGIEPRESVDARSLPKDEALASLSEVLGVRVNSFVQHTRTDGATYIMSTAVGDAHFTSPDDVMSMTRFSASLFKHGIVLSEQVNRKNWSRVLTLLVACREVRDEWIDEKARALDILARYLSGSTISIESPETDYARVVTLACENGFGPFVASVDGEKHLFISIDRLVWHVSTSQSGNKITEAEARAILALAGISRARSVEWVRGTHRRRIVYWHGPLRNLAEHYSI